MILCLQEISKTCINGGWVVVHPKDVYINSTKCSRRNRCIRRKWFSRVLHTWSIEKLGLKPSSLAFQSSKLFRLILLLDLFLIIFFPPT